MNLIDRIKAHSGGSELVRKIEVPEWGTDGEPFVICHRLVTLEDMEVIQKLDPGPENEIKREARLLCLKAMDADGTPMLKMTEVSELMKEASVVVLRRVVNEMVDPKPVEEIEKN
jgi:hypothetical protein